MVELGTRRTTERVRDGHLHLRVRAPYFYSTVLTGCCPKPLFNKQVIISKIVKYDYYLVTHKIVEAG
jgi:hypothetical protein